MRYSKQQIYQISAAVLFLIGAIFLLITTFSEYTWAFWVGLGITLIASAFYILVWIENRKNITKKLTEPSYSDKPANKDSHEKIQISKNQTPES